MEQADQQSRWQIVSTAKEAGLTYLHKRSPKAAFDHCTSSIFHPRRNFQLADRVAWSGI